MIEESLLPMGSRVAGLAKGFGQEILQGFYPRGKIARGIGEFHEEMKVIGHQDITAHENVHCQSGLAELQKRVVDRLRRKQGLAGRGAARHKIGWVMAMDAFQAVQALGHTTTSL
jgi:hypothetical protein